MSKKQNGNHQIQGMTVRGQRHGDEDKIVDLLNLCYPDGWGNMERWKWFYPQTPSFESSNIFLIDKDGQIISHRGSHPRQLVIRERKIPVVFLGDNAVHPDYRELGLYRSLHRIILDTVTDKGMCLAISTNRRGSITYNHNQKTGFVVVKQNPTYVKLINYSKVFKEELAAFISRREDLKSLFSSLPAELYIYFGKTAFSPQELLNDARPIPPVNNERGRVRIILAEDSLPWLIRFVEGNKFEKVKSFLYLLFTWKVRVSIKPGSVLALARVIRVGIRMLRYV